MDLSGGGARRFGDRAARDDRRCLCSALPLHILPRVGTACQSDSRGIVQVADSDNFKVATTVAATLVTMQPGAMRQMHWHPNADEWQYYIKGKARMGVFNTGPNVLTMDFNPGDIGYVKRNYGHYVQNVGDSDLQFFAVFRTGNYEEISLSSWLKHSPRRPRNDAGTGVEHGVAADGGGAPEHRPEIDQQVASGSVGDRAQVADGFRLQASGSGTRNSSPEIKWLNDRTASAIESFGTRRCRSLRPSSQQFVTQHEGSNELERRRTDLSGSGRLCHGNKQWRCDPRQSRTAGRQPNRSPVHHPIGHLCQLRCHHWPPF